MNQDAQQMAIYAGVGGAAVLGGYALYANAKDKSVNANIRKQKLAMEQERHDAKMAKKGGGVIAPVPSASSNPIRTAIDNIGANISDRRARRAIRQEEKALGRAQQAHEANLEQRVNDMDSRVQQKQREAYNRRVQERRNAAPSGTIATDAAGVPRTPKTPGASKVITKLL